MPGHVNPGGAPMPLPYQHQNASFPVCHLFCPSVLLPQNTVAELSAPLWHLLNTTVAHMDPAPSRGPNDLSQVPTVFSPVSSQCSLANAPRTLGDSSIVVNALLCLRLMGHQGQVLCTTKVPFGSVKVMTSVTTESFKYAS